MPPRPRKDRASIMDSAHEGWRRCHTRLQRRRCSLQTHLSTEIAQNHTSTRYRSSEKKDIVLSFGKMFPTSRSTGPTAHSRMRHRSPAREGLRLDKNGAHHPCSQAGQSFRAVWIVGGVHEHARRDARPVLAFQVRERSDPGTSSRLAVLSHRAVTRTLAAILRRSRAASREFGRHEASDRLP